MKLGFTGSRKISYNQCSRLYKLIKGMNIDVAIHGGCKGFDSCFHEVVKELCNAKIFVHPGNQEQHDIFVKKNDCEVLPVKPYLERNKDIVNLSDEIIACPGTLKEILRSGTWATIRYAQKIGKKITIIFPDGSIEEDE